MELQDWAESTTSGQTKAGKFLVITMFLCNVVAVVLYIVDTNHELVEECVSWDQLLTLQIDFALGIVFFMYFIIRQTCKRCLTRPPVLLGGLKCEKLKPKELMSPSQIVYWLD